MSDIQTHDGYIAQSAEHLRPALVKLHKQLRTMLPDADEIVAYNMPGYNIGNATIVGYAAFSKQCGIYLSGEAIASLQKELEAAGLQPTKTGVKFTPDKPIPEPLIKQLVSASRESLGV